MDFLYPFFFGAAVPANADTIVFLGMFAILFAGYMAWMVGSNDFANAMATSVGSHALTYRQAVVIGAIANFFGAILAGSGVTDTVRKGIVNADLFTYDPNLLILGMVSAMLAAGLWLHLATNFGLPVSTTHSIIGSIIGFALMLFGFNAVHWDKVITIVLSWILSPVGGGILAAILFFIIQRTILTNKDPLNRMRRFGPVLGAVTIAMLVLSALWENKLPFLRTHSLTITGIVVTCLIAAVIGFVALWFVVRRFIPQHHPDLSRIERIFIMLQVLTATYVAFSHGANDVANSVGPVAAVLDILRNGVVSAKAPVPSWILIYGGAGIAIGLSLHGYKVMRTVGENITEITPSRGFAAELSTASVVSIFSRFGIPISTTHTLVGAVIGVGLVSGVGAVNFKVLRNILFSWLLTLPVAAILCMVVFAVLRVILRF